MVVDMLGKTSNEDASIVAQIREIIAVNVDPDSIRSERIIEGADYEGSGSDFSDSVKNQYADRYWLR